MKSWTLNAAASYSDNKDFIFINDFPIQNKNSFLETRLSFSHPISELSVIRFGGEFQNVNSSTAYSTFSSTEFKEKYTAAFVEADLYITTKLVSRIGLRGENSEILSKQNLAPRISLAYKTGEFSQFSLHTAIFTKCRKK